MAFVDRALFPGKKPIPGKELILPLIKAALIMNPFVFSKKAAPRLARHMTFWMLYFGCILLMNIPDIRHWGSMDREMFRNAFTDAISYLPVYLLAVYSALYIILPLFLRKRKLSLLLWYVLILFPVAITSGYFITKAIYTSRGYHSDELDFFATAWHNCMANLISISAAAVILKIMKDYWLRQRENEFLEIEHIRKKLDLLKMQLHPRILFASLQRIYHEIDYGTHEGPEMILKLSDLLSYLLYETESEQIPLIKEVKMIQSYLDLKKLEYKRQIELRMETEGYLDDCWIEPGLFLPLLEICIEGCGGDERLTRVTVRLKVTGSKIFFSLTNDGPGFEISRDPTAQMTLRTIRERVRGPNFRNSKLDLKSRADGLSLLMRLEANKQKPEDILFMKENV